MTRDKFALYIRTFQNADLPDLVRIWVEHWSAAGPPPYVNQAKFEQAVLARTFFDPDTLLVAESEGIMRGWCHFAPPHYIPSPETSGCTIVHALCLGSDSDDKVAMHLLAAIEKSPQATSHIRIGLVRDAQRGYAGLEPIGFGIGIPLSDYRSNSFLHQGGYVRGKPHLRMIANVAQYRPPLNRTALQFRRSTKVTFKPIFPTDSRVAASLGHVDVEAAELQERGGSTIASVSIWFSDPEAEVMSPSAAILDLNRQHAVGTLQAAESYLIGSLIHSLNERNIQIVETSIDSDQADLIEQLQTLQFQIADEGSCWEKKLHAK